MKNKFRKITLTEIDKSAIEEAAKLLGKDGIVIYPTETVYGLGADIRSARGLKKIYQIKGRDASKPVSVMVANPVEVERLCAEIPETAQKLMARFWPGPLTIVFKASPALPAHFHTVNETIGIRSPDHPVCRELVTALGHPITSTSVNQSGRPAITETSNLSGEMIDRVDLILDSGICDGLPSTVIDVTQTKPAILREGAIPSKKIWQVLTVQ